MSPEVQNRGVSGPTKRTYYRQQRSSGNLMFLHLSVILFTGRRCGRHPSGQTPPWTDTPPGRHPLDIHPQGRHPWADTPRQTPPGHTFPWADTPLGRHPLGQTPLPTDPLQADNPPPTLGRHPGNTSPCAVHAGIRSTSGLFASYWNAFLCSQKYFLKNCSRG